MGNHKVFWEPFYMICTMTHGIELSQPVVQKLEKCVERVHALSSDKASSLRRMDCTLTPPPPLTLCLLVSQSCALDSRFLNRENSGVKIRTRLDVYSYYWNRSGIISNTNEVNFQNPVQHLSNHFKEEHAFYLHSQLIHAGSCKPCIQAIQSNVEEVVYLQEKFFCYCCLGHQETLGCQGWRIDPHRSHDV